MLEFDANEHVYTLDGKKLISVTQLMRKHGLAPNYDGVSQEVLEAKAKRGTLIHEEIEAWNKEKKLGFTKELSQYIDYVESTGVDVLESEMRLYNDIVAGTCDLFLEFNGKPYIADVKTTYTLHKESVSWQLSIYAYLYWNQVDSTNTLASLDYADTRGQAYHFSAEGLKVVDIPLKPYEEVEKLMECERKGELYKIELSNINIDLAEVGRLESIIKYCDAQKKKAEEQQKALKEALMKAMQKRGIKTIEKDGIQLTIKDEYTRSSVDSKKLKEEMPDIYEKYLKESKVKASLVVTIKEDK